MSNRIWIREFRWNLRNSPLCRIEVRSSLLRFQRRWAGTCYCLACWLKLPYLLPWLCVFGASSCWCRESRLFELSSSHCLSFLDARRIGWILRSYPCRLRFDGCVFGSVRLHSWVRLWPHSWPPWCISGHWDLGVAWRRSWPQVLVVHLRGGSVGSRAGRSWTWLTSFRVW